MTLSIGQAASEFRAQHTSNGKILPTTESGLTSFDSPESVKLAHTLLNGKIAFIWWVIVGDDFHVTKANFETIPIIIKLAPMLSHQQIARFQKKLDKRDSAPRRCAVGRHDDF